MRQKAAENADAGGLRMAWLMQLVGKTGQKQ